MSATAQTNANAAITPADAVLDVSVDTEEIRREISTSWKWMLFAAVVTVAGGAACIAMPHVTTFAVVTVLAATVFVVGCVNLAGVLWAPRGLRVDTVLTGVVQVLLAAVAYFYPAESIVSLTILVATAMLAQGIVRIVFGWNLRGLEGSGWLLFGGICTVALSCLILYGLPQTAVWVIGLLFGVDMLSVGAARMALAIEGRRFAKAVGA